MEIVTGTQMKRIDRRAIEEIGMPGLLLMERAGLKAYECTLSYVQEKGWEDPLISVVVGKGNNGGDGLVVGRLLKEKGFFVQIVLLGDKDAFQGEAKMNLEIAKRLDLDIVQIEDEDDLLFFLEPSSLIIDAMLGTGLKGEVYGLIFQAIELINTLSIPVISLDIPSGLDSDTGEILGAAIKANRTVTFGLPKLGHYLYPGASRVGQLQVVDIGIPNSVIQEEGIRRFLLTPGYLKSYLPHHSKDSHKGQIGHLLLLAGSPGMTGAAALSAQGALKGGAGLVTLGIPESLNSIMEVKLTEVMTRPLVEEVPGYLTLKAMEGLQDLLSKVQAIALGPGLGTNPLTQRLVHEILRVDRPLILDADGINHLEDPALLKERKAPTILTPHPGELARLLKISTKEVLERRLLIAEEFASTYQLILVLKGAPTVVSDGETTYINSTGNVGMATAGSGDVLTGLIASLVVQRVSPLFASLLGVYLHGLAGDLGLGALGSYALMASDLINYLPLALNSLLKGGGENEGRRYYEYRCGDC